VKRLFVMILTVLLIGSTVYADAADKGMTLEAYKATIITSKKSCKK